jgi:Bacterial EndoU nuclease
MSETGDSGGGDGGSSDAGAEASAEASAGSEGGQPAAEAGESGPAEAGSAEAPDATDGQPGNSQPDNSAADSGTGTDAGVESSAETSDGSGARADDTEPGENEPVQAGQGENNPQPQDSNAGDGAISESVGDGQQAKPADQDPAGPDVSQAEAAESAAGPDGEAPGGNGPAEQPSEDGPSTEAGDNGLSEADSGETSGQNLGDSRNGDLTDQDLADQGPDQSEAAETRDEAEESDTEPGENEPVQAGQGENNPQPQDSNAGDGAISESVGDGQQAEPADQDPAGPDASQAGAEASAEASAGSEGGQPAAEAGESGPAEASSAEAPDATDGQPGNSAADSETGTDAGVESSPETSDGSGAGADDTEPGENEPVQAGQGENVPKPQDTNVGDGVRSDGSGNNPNLTETFNEAAGVAGNEHSLSDGSTESELADEDSPSSDAFQGDQHQEYTGLREGSGADRPSGWDAPGIVSHPDRPPADSIRLTEDRRVHILEGDDGGGGHRHGTGNPGKTEFPEDWDNEKIAENVMDVARDPDESPVQQDWNDRWLVSGVRDGVGIVAIVEPDGQVWTAWPREGSPGVTKNPKET